MPQRKTIEDMCALAEARGGKCLSTEYVNVRSLLKWQCHNGHVWETNPVNIINGNWCSVCSNRKKLNLDDMQKLAESRGGKCLSDKFINNKVPLKWECSEGHVWEARPDNVKNQGHWCPVCIRGKIGDNKRLTIEEMQKVAEAKGGKCLSSFYVDSKTKLQWQCKKGHIWEAVPAHIRNSRSWCPVCALDTLGNARRLSIEEIKELAESKGGKCLSETYKNRNTLMTWQCEKGHIWKATASSIKGGNWCHHCSGRYRYTIEDVKEYARSKGGLCLSDSYKNSRSRLKWQCAENHIWEASFHDIKVDNTWCPHCYKFYSEDKVRFIFESLFNRPFKKDRKALDNNLELDGFNKELQLAFEYHGIQHYKQDPFFFKSRCEFERRKHLDNLKEQLCLEKAIKLIIIPFDSYNSDESLLHYILEQLRQLNIEIEIPLSDFSFNDFYKSSQILDELRALAESRNGILLSNHYINDKSKLIWQCEQGHTWGAIPNNVKNNSWCPYCSGLMRKSVQDMVELAKSRGGKCLSIEYKGNKEKLKWQCPEGHIWEARPDSIVVGRWCPECSGRKKITIEDMHFIAQKKGGKCLSTIYYTDKPLKWQCEKGHVWEALSHSVKKGQWCRKCSGHQKLTIEEMKEIAKSRGGECLSDHYKDNKTKLRWRCSSGHEWEAIPNNIKSKGQWCPMCSKI